MRRRTLILILTANGWLGCGGHNAVEARSPPGGKALLGDGQSYRADTVVYYDLGYLPAANGRYPEQLGDRSAINVFDFYVNLEPDQTQPFRIAMRHREQWGQILVGDFDHDRPPPHPFACARPGANGAVCLLTGALLYADHYEIIPFEVDVYENELIGSTGLRIVTHPTLQAADGEQRGFEPSFSIALL